MLGGVASAINPDMGRNRANARVYAYIDGVFSNLKYQRGMNKMKKETFRKAYYGYLNLLEHGKIRNRRYLTVCDFSLSSNKNRLWVIDVARKKIVINTLVAHGSKTGEEYARHFSNIEESHQSSLGFYVTKHSYIGSKGYAMRLNGVDGRFNNKADSRDVVMHGAKYVSHAYARANKRIGRSWGCPSVEMKMAKPIIDKIKNGSCLFIYHPTKSYLRSSFWLNDRVGRLPKNAKYIVDNSAKKPVEKANTIKKEQDELEPGAAPITEPAPIDSSVITIIKYEDSDEVKALKNQKNVKIRTIVLAADEITPEMRAKMIKRKKIVHKIHKIIRVDSKKDKAVLE